MDLTLKTYRHVWTKKDRNGDLQYEYLCSWSDGSESRECTLPWGRMDGAVELPATSDRELQAIMAPVTGAADALCAELLAAQTRRAEFYGAVVKASGVPAMLAAE